jgi:hypothetical protein
MQTLHAHFDGKVIVPDDPPDLAVGTRLRVTVEPMDDALSARVCELDLPLLTGVDPQLVHSIMEGHEFDVESAKIERLLPMMQ